jgi:hypothetical protein
MAGLILASGCIGSNKPPVITGFEADSDSLIATESCELRVFAYDPDGDELSYQWSTNGGNIAMRGATAIWTSPNTPANYTITVMATDGKGGEAERQLSLDVFANNPPVINGIAAERSRANRGESIVVECLALDADQQDLTYTWSASGGTFAGDGPTTAWLAPDEPGTYTIMVVVTDGSGGEASAELNIEVTPNHPPVIEKLTAAQMVVVFGKSTDIECVASDPDGDEITYAWNAAEGEISGEGAAVIWTAPDKCGEFVVVTVTVFDSRGGETSRELSIGVRKPG